MPTSEQNIVHLDIYEDRYELHDGEVVSIFRQGKQNKQTSQNYQDIIRALDNGFLENLYEKSKTMDYSSLSQGNAKIIRDLVDGVTSENGRALLGVAFLQMVIKAIKPNQTIRLHKGATRNNGFSWVEGISMRTLDSNYTTPFLREKDLVKLNKYGAFMTRSLAENYPYTSLYKADMKGPFAEWIKIVNALENNSLPPDLGLGYLISILRNRSDNFLALSNEVTELSHNKKFTYNSAFSKITTFFNQTNYSARAFEVVMHAFMQTIQDSTISELELAPLSQMRSANKKHGNVGDIELLCYNKVVESWDAKYGKPYLRDELEELRDKLLTNSEVQLLGFVVDSEPDLRPDIQRRINEIQAEFNVDLRIVSFSKWVNLQIDRFDISDIDAFANSWVQAIVESFAQKRTTIAPIDEPCDQWLSDLKEILSS